MNPPAMPSEVVDLLLVIGAGLLTIVAATFLLLAGRVSG